MAYLQAFEKKREWQENNFHLVGCQFEEQTPCPYVGTFYSQCSCHIAISE
jgi:hypothetical protein